MGFGGFSTYPDGIPAGEAGTVPWTDEELQARGCTWNEQAGRWQTPGGHLVTPGARKGGDYDPFWEPGGMR